MYVINVILLIFNKPKKFQTHKTNYKYIAKLHIYTLS